MRAEPVEAPGPPFDKLRAESPLLPADLAYGGGDSRSDRGIEHAGNDVARIQLSGATRLAMALAAADSISSVMSCSPPSSRPRKNPGKASTLLI